MKEAEVSLRIALYYKNGYTQKDAYVSLDAVHIKSVGNVIFDIGSFMIGNGCKMLYKEFNSDGV